MPQVSANGVAALGVFRPISRDLDHPAIRVQAEMMGGLLVPKPHHLVATLHYAIVVLIRRGGFLLRMHRATGHVLIVLLRLLLCGASGGINCDKKEQLRGNTQTTSHF